ncbi:T9SS type A sorting domain-containing protein [Lacinutrix sp. C3R15]|uniref:T9SS type A sorting domain-containing protein n=1 Tax=Flavobacteriaceae TaxID=49546 RepID=UPI001C087400|nr:MULTISPECIES: T9SS type A sorting domain-containing protein [Flavobacteriaceae]MBU2937997.1 T9SS type A sorting domain-containing protein [Lacinutrix sp. C3R15]MDO6621311.1 T9SS type A sorting domain-containing protein [Oceanihabitans sp. 1_MG-2023]
MIKILHCCLAFFAFNVMSGQVFSEDFSGLTSTSTGNNFSLDGWNQTRNTSADFANGYSVDDGGAWLRDGFNNNGTTGAIRINMTNNVKRDWLISPYIDLSTTPTTGSYVIEWDMAFANNNNGTTFQELNAGDEIRLLISVDGGNTFSSLAYFDSNSVIQDGGETFSIELSDNSYFVDEVQIVFWAYEGNVTTNATNVFVDNIKITDQALSITDFTETERIALYPNPTLDNLYVKDTDIEKVEVFTLLGKKIDVEYNNATIYTSALTTGTYIVHLTNKNGYTHTSKFIKN